MGVEVILDTHIIVFYNQLIENSIAVTTLMKHESNILIIDNSNKQPILERNQEFCTYQNIGYHSMNGNKGLASAYNTAVSMIDTEWLIMWDQDTKINDDFFEKINLKNISEKVDILIPQIRANEKIISPCSLVGPMVLNYNEFRTITAINSGMIIRKKALLEIGLYNDALFLDYIDHDLMNRFAKESYSIEYLKELVIEQQFSSFELQSKDAALFRFKIYKKDFKVFCNEFPFGNIYSFIKILYRSIKLNVKYKTFSFFMR
ncbi:glycosyltransferase [Periweissella ghanensis]|uniref:Glycosyltransferase 2-like domain-containing protein n=1 Tax=Periweissella ghanensis TaxID=467997 RepID=A0ABN8BSB1_9LACO|nr:glycosyltransferase [Periweissella ghanensis]MCM0600251.1 glycosyltransferase [Periweissella ghanensis]CAH0419117.1 hypothetical protein WGH24286_01564 [Periweissella ghanensis]